MASSPRGAGGDHLVDKHNAVGARSAIADLNDVLIVEDEQLDAERMRATLHLIFGYGLQIRRAATLGASIDLVIARKPDLVVLDDVLKPSDTASQTIPFLRRAGYDGPIVVVSGQATRSRRLELMAAGAADVIHKDDVDSVRLTEILARVFKQPSAT